MGDDIRLAPVALIKNEINEPMAEGWEEVRSEIVVDPDFMDCLDGIEENSHITVIFWMDRVTQEQRGLKKVHPRGRKDLPYLGIFATRCPQRPNPLGLATVKLLKREGNRLEIAGLDALNGTPVLDIKPYSRRHDYIEGARCPAWTKELW